MRPDTIKSLADMALATERILEGTSKITRQELGANWSAQSAVERQFEILGEALVRIRRTDPGLFAEIPDSDDIVRMRNWISHGYDVVDLDTLWSAARDEVPKLRAWILDRLPSS